MQRPRLEEAEGTKPAGAGADTRELTRPQPEPQLLSQLRRELGGSNAKLQRCGGLFKELLVQLASREAAADRDALTLAAQRLGRQDPSGALQGGETERQLQIDKRRLGEQRARLEQQRPANLRPLEEKEQPNWRWESLQVYQHCLRCLEREEADVRLREEQLHVERALHLRRLRDQEAWERSSFRHYPVVGKMGLAEGRYQLMNFLGKGGFSEVFKAFDLKEFRYCAVKISEPTSGMNDLQRRNYIKHVQRECEIQKELDHPNILKLYDSFPISTDAIAAVLEYSEGETLDAVLRSQGALPEKEAKVLLLQLLSGLKYINSAGRRIIHYDLKPSNLFLHFGKLQIADFGLSKQGELDAEGASPGPSMDLTSPGAGTCWYLPPECFTQEPSRICSKVDVWSTGVIFFEMLFNSRPFGSKLSHQKMWLTAADPDMFNLRIPTQPKVSGEGKSLLRRMLAFHREDRLDVSGAYGDQYFRQRAKKSMALAGPAATKCTVSPSQGTTLQLRTVAGSGPPVATDAA